MTSIETEPLQAAAERLRQAGTLRRPCGPVRELVGPGGITAAYAVQRLVLELQRIGGEQVRGRRVVVTPRGLDGEPLATEPVVGVILESMLVASGAQIPMSRLLQPSVEPAVAIRLATDLGWPATDEEIRAAIAGVALAVDVADRRVDDGGATVVDVVADNASTGMVVLAEQFVEIEPTGDEVVEIGLAELPGVVRRLTGGDLVEALSWLARAAAGQDDPLAAEEVIVLTGYPGARADPAEGDRFQAVATGLASAVATFTATTSLHRPEEASA